MMIEKSGSIRLKDIPIPSGATPEQRELAQGMVRVNHLYRSALKVAVTQMEILDEEFASLYDHSPIHHIEYRIKTLESISDKLRRRGYDVTIDNIYAYIQDVAGIRVICNYLDDIYYLRSLLTRSESFKVLREVDYIQQPKESGYRSLHLIIDVPIVISEGTLHLPVEIQLRTIAMDMWRSESFKVLREVDYIQQPKESGYRSLHLIIDVPIVISEGTLHLPVEIQLRTIAMDMWASLEHELRYKSDRNFSDSDAARLRLCSEAISEIDREMQDIYQGKEPSYHE